MSETVSTSDVLADIKHTAASCVNSNIVGSVDCGSRDADARGGMVVTFDYSKIEDETVARELREAVSEIRDIHRSAIADVGNHLIRAKGHLPHGGFSQWAEVELNMTLRTAENYMNAARFLEGKPKSVSLLPPTTVYKLASLAALQAPPAVVKEVLDAAASGAPLPVRAVKTKLADAVATIRKQMVAAKKSPDQIAKEGRNARQREQRHQRELQADAEQRRREALEREERLRPIADRLSATLAEDLFPLSNALDDWEDVRALRGLIEQAGRSASSPVGSGAVL
jgi:hypothetical protein